MRVSLRFDELVAKGAVLNEIFLHVRSLLKTDPQIGCRLQARGLLERMVFLFCETIKYLDVTRILLLCKSATLDS